LGDNRKHVSIWQRVLLNGANSRQHGPAFRHIIDSNEYVRDTTHLGGYHKPEEKTEMSFYAYVKQPEENEKIWHYLDFTRFMLLIHQKMLFFEQAEKLDYLFEGYGTIGAVAPGLNVHDPMDSQEFTTLCRSCLVVNSWHMHESESAALWKQYSSRHAEIAIQSTVQRLKKGLNYSLLKYVKIGAVNYQPPSLNPDETGVSIEVDYFYKRQSFAHEREIRVLAHARDLELVTRGGGLAVPADLDVLIEKVHVAPQAPHWFAELVGSITAEAYHIEAEVIQSNLHREVIV
jgi:hypothetical protein